jgi:hypothetical protein
VVLAFAVDLVFIADFEVFLHDLVRPAHLNRPKSTFFCSSSE